jgi:hypothetical protein
MAETLLLQRESAADQILCLYRDETMIAFVVNTYLPLNPIVFCVGQLISMYIIDAYY